MVSKTFDVEQLPPGEHYLEDDGTRFMNDIPHADVSGPVARGCKIKLTQIYSNFVFRERSETLRSTGWFPANKLGQNYKK